MNFKAKSSVIVLCVFLLGGLTVPLCQAQAQTLPRVIKLGADGAYLGIRMENVNADNMSTYNLKSERGVIVNSVEQGSPAEKAKLRENDVLLEFAGYPVWSTQQLQRLVRETPVGRNVELVVSRDGKIMNLNAQIGEREGFGSRAGNRNPIIIGPNDRSFQFQFPDNFGERFQVLTARKPRLGVTLQPLTDQLGEFFGVPDKKGALVSSVESGSPSDGKLKSGDVITRADDKTINDPEDLVQFVREKDKGTIALKVIRDKKEITVTINLPSEDSQRGYKL
jgi:serine protease Do